MALIDVLAAAADPNNAGGWGTLDVPAPQLPDGPRLIPVDHDPFASAGPFDAGLAIGDPETAGLAAASQAMMPAVASYGRGLLRDMAERLAPNPNAPDPRTNFAAAALDPAGIEQAMNIALSAGPGTVKEAKPGVTAYHGSPHDFPTFSSEAIGSGEGAQAYGRGLYFAEAEPVAQSYRMVDDLITGSLRVGDRETAVRDMSPIEQFAWRNAHDSGGVGPAIDELQKAIKAGGPNRWTRQHDLDNYQAILPILQKWHEGGAELSPGGHMYQARLNLDPESLLDWDKPIREQPQAVKDLANEVYQAKGVTIRPVFEGFSDVMIGNSAIGIYPNAEAPAVAQNVADHVPGKGRDLYRELVDRQLEVPLRTRTKWASSSEHAADELRRRGIPGVRYLDQGSRGGEGQGTHNYVVFDDKLIDIIKKYGLGALIAGGAAAIGGNAQAATHAIPVDHDPFAAAGGP